MIRLTLVAWLALAAADTFAGAPGPPPSTAAKALWSDTVFVGKVTKVEGEAVEVLPYAGAPMKVKMNSATVKIETGFLGTKNLTEVRVLMVAKPERPPPGRPGPVQLADQQEGLFFLVRHPVAHGDFVVQYAPVLSTAPKFKADVDEVKDIARILADPMKALTTGNADDRLSAANTLLGHYRRGPAGGGPTKEVALPPEETKAILKAMLDADWGVRIPEGPGRSRFGPRLLLDWVGLTPGTPGGLPAITVGANEDINAKYFAAYKAWHAKNAATHRITKFVPKD